MRRLLLAAALSLLPVIAVADQPRPYFTVGLGQGYLHNNGENMWWIQNGWDHYEEPKSTVFRVGLGHDINRWLAVELNYHDLGSYNHFAGFVVPEDQYNARAQDCVAQCPNTRWGYLAGRVKSASLSALATWHVAGKLSVSGRLGVNRYHAYFRSYVSPADPQARHWEDGDWFTQWGTAPLWGSVITYDRVSFEWTHFAKIHADQRCCSAYRDATTYLLSYRWDL